jgi:hypothetical protein
MVGYEYMIRTGGGRCTYFGTSAFCRVWVCNECHDFYRSLIVCLAFAPWDIDNFDKFMFNLRKYAIYIYFIAELYPQKTPCLDPRVSSAELIHICPLVYIHPPLNRCPDS